MINNAFSPLEGKGQCQGNDAVFIGMEILLVAVITLTIMHHMTLAIGDLGDNNDNASARAPGGRGQRHSRRPHSPAGVRAICWKFSSQKIFISVHNQNLNDDELAPIAEQQNNDYD